MDPADRSVEEECICADAHVERFRQHLRAHAYHRYVRPVHRLNDGDGLQAFVLLVPLDQVTDHLPQTR